MNYNDLSDDDLKKLLESNSSANIDDLVIEPIDEPKPAQSLAGPQTPREKIVQRINQNRGVIPKDNYMSDFDIGPKPQQADPNQIQEALNFAKNNAQAAGIGRALSTLASATGYKPDYGAYSDIEKQGQYAISTAQTDAQNRQQAVKNWIEQKSRQAENAENRDFRSQQLQEQIDSRKQIAELQGGAKSEIKNNKNYVDTQTALEQERGLPALQQAEKDLYAADKVKSLVKQGGGDPNSLNPQFVKLLVSEVGKIAQGGVPTTHELQDLTPATLNGQLAGVWQRFSNSPTPANAGEFIKQYQAYANSVSDDARNLIKNHYGRILNSRKRLLSDEDQKTLNDNYLNRFEKESPSQQQSQQQFPRQVRKGNKVATVSSQQELNEAMTEGFQ